MENTLLESPVFDLEKIEVTQLPELQGLKEKQLQIVEENPFVQITDNKTYEEAKKSRTTLVSARTEIQNQDKLIASKIKKFREAVAGISAELIAITQPHEEKQQSEVKRYEAEKEAEKLEKQRIEDERKAKIKEKIEAIYTDFSSRIQSLQFAKIENFKIELEDVSENTDATTFEEFELDFAERMMLLKSQLSAKEIQLNEIEAQRVENERLKAEREKLDAERKEIEAKAKIEADKLEADRLKIQNEQKEAQAKLDAERAEMEAEKAKIAKAEADKKAKELAEALAIEKAETARRNAEKAELEVKAKAEREEALKPEKEKAIDFLNCLVFKNDLPQITDAELLNHVESFVLEINQQRKDLIEFITNL